jgi:hypothetical protein
LANSLGIQLAPSRADLTEFQMVSSSVVLKVPLKESKTERMTADQKVESLAD